VIDRSVKPVHQSIIIAVVNGELTCKRLVRKGKQIILVPENPAYQPLTVTEEMDFVVWGVVTRLLIDATKI
jgi:DNA polymerase V